jgi:choline dehydrogenase-like flavoprotein
VVPPVRWPRRGWIVIAMTTSTQMTGTQMTENSDLLDVAVVGGGQAGLAVAWHLRRLGLRFLVLDAGPAIGHVWRSRWDSLRLFTSARYNALPGRPSPAGPTPTRARMPSPTTCATTRPRSTCRSARTAE